MTARRRLSGAQTIRRSSALREGSTFVNASLTFPDGRTGLASCAVTVTPHTGDVLSEQAPTASRDGWQQINCTVCGHEATHILSRHFLDLDGTQWYADGVDDIVDRGLMNGTGPVTFEPDSTMTRAMLVTVLWRSAGSPNEGTNGFTDVPADQWYTQAVAWAAQNGIVNGVGNNKFDPDAKITREQLAAVLYRYAGKVGMDVTARADLKLFPDAGSVSAYATDALSWCVANGIVNGTLEHGTAYLDPQGSATRAQVATVQSGGLLLFLLQCPILMPEVVHMKSRRLSLFLTFLKIGAFTFGGGYAMIALLEHELIEKKGWIGHDEFLDMAAIAESTPGPVAVNAATYVGFHVAGVSGAALATLAVCLPSFLIIFAISQFFDRFLALTTVGYAFRGIQVCVVYLIASAGWKMVRKLPHRPLDNVILAIVLLAMLACSMLAVSFSSIYFILLSGTAGLCVYGVRQLRRGGGKP